MDVIRCTVEDQEEDSADDSNASGSDPDPLSLPAPAGAVCSVPAQAYDDLESYLHYHRCEQVTPKAVLLESHGRTEMQGTATATLASICGQVRHGQLQHGQVRHRQVKHGQERHGQVKHRQVRHAQVRSCCSPGARAVKHATTTISRLIKQACW